MELSSPKGKLNLADSKRILNNALTFLAPLAILYLVSVINIIQESGVSLEAFRLTPAVIGAITLYVLNVALDFFRKLSKDNTK